jgi:hypothetical protein
VARGIRGELPDNESILVSEGLEDLLSALTIAEIGLTEETRYGFRRRVVPARDLRAVCGISLSFMAVVEFPPQIRRVIILQQRDAKGSKAEQGLPRVVERFRQQGRQVLLMPPPAWAGLKDMNDFARRLAPCPEETPDPDRTLTRRLATETFSRLR